METTSTPQVLTSTWSPTYTPIRISTQIPTSTSSTLLSTSTTSTQIPTSIPDPELDEVELARLNSSNDPFPLHYAAERGRTPQAMKLLQRSPSLGFQLNRDDLSPLHLAIEKGRDETVLCLISLRPELIGVQGPDGKTPLHLVAEHEKIDLLAVFLLTFPDAINKVTFHGESAVHWAVKKEKFESFKVLYGWLRRTGRQNVLRWTDWKGNTLLHVAAEAKQETVIAILPKEGVPLNYKNAGGETALDISNDRGIHKQLSALGVRKGEDVENLRFSVYLKQNLTLWEKFLRLFLYLELKLSNKHRNFILVVAALICTACFETLVQTPKTLPEKGISYIIFGVLNAVSFIASSAMIIILLPRRNFVLDLGLYCFLVAYAVLLYMFEKHSQFYWITACIVIILFFIKGVIVWLGRHVPSTVRDVLPSQSSMIILCVQMDKSSAGRLGPDCDNNGI